MYFGAVNSTSQFTHGCSLAMLIDSHAHMFDEDFGADLPEVLQRARDAGIDAIVVPGTNVKTSREAVELAERYDFLYACVGVHPHEASRIADEDLAAIETLAGNPNVVAIGEIGLDFHYDFSPPETQTSVFLEQIDIAVQRELPIVVHTRESVDQAIDIVVRAASAHSDWRATSPGRVDGIPAMRGVFHCFTGSAEQANELNASGFLVSYPGIVTFKNSPVVETLKSTGYTRILLETDSPYLAPVPLRGKRNEPANMALVARKISELFGISVDEVGHVTSENSRALFGLTT
jgi:TatD DNase family protein